MNFWCAVRNGHPLSRPSVTPSVNDSCFTSTVREGARERKRASENRPKMESLVLSPGAASRDLVPDLPAVSGHPSGASNLSVWNPLINTSEVICPTDPFTFPPLRKGDLARNNPFF